MFKDYTKKILQILGLTDSAISNLLKKVSLFSVKLALSQHNLTEMVKRLREIEPDISDQESRENEDYDSYNELKRRAVHAFQCSLMLKAVEFLDKKEVTIVDIGDSSGRHMKYLDELLKEKLNIHTISVNLDQRAIEKIRARGRTALLCRAEDISSQPEVKSVDLFTSFEMVEHLHNPAIFFHRLALKSNCNKMLITVPYVKQSRVGLHYLRLQFTDDIFAEDEHIFELSPEDWTLLILHSGWKVIHSKIYYQYPKRIPVLSYVLSRFWKKNDFEGFWGAILERDTTFSETYKDWED